MIHVAPEWRNSGERYDSVLLRTARAGQYWFAEVQALFLLHLPRGQTVELAIASVYTSVGRNKVTDYIELKRSSTPDIVFIDSIVRACHILPPTATNPRYTVQDLLDGDMYLRLSS